MAAAVGIAPTSPRLQRGANLSQLHSQKLVPLRGFAPRSSAYRAGALLLSYGGMSEKVVARQGNAPRSAGCEPAILLLNYQAKMGEGGAPRNCTSDPTMWDGWIQSSFLV